VKLDTIKAVKAALARARREHPEYDEARGYDGIVALAAEELGEMAQAVNDGKPENFRAEALDLIAVLVRFLEGDADTGRTGGSRAISELTVKINIDASEAMETLDKIRGTASDFVIVDEPHAARGTALDDACGRCPHDGAV
jgi:hypothetical protein